MFICLLGQNLLAQKVYSGRFELGFNSNYNITLSTTQGYFFKPDIFAGIGLGLNSSISPYKVNEKEINTIVCPVFLDGEYIPFKSRVSPFVSAQLGIENIFIEEIKPYGATNESEYELVGVFSPSIGLRIRLIKNFGINLRFSTHLRTKSIYNISKQSYSYAIGIIF